MNLNLLWLLLSLLGAFLTAVLLAPLFIKLFTKKNVGQNVLNYVEQHQSKSGTPTMGGWIFIVPTLIFSLIAFSTFSLVACACILSYGLIGFFDDFLKFRYHRNLGLKAYQKIIAQFGAALILAIFCFKNPNIGSFITLPFTNVEWNMGWLFVPFCAFGFIALTNGVNLTDGLDGLAGWCGVAYFSVFTALIWFLHIDAVSAQNFVLANELFSLAIFSTSILGGVLGYLWFNSYPAKIMMGDTGSLALGGAASAVAFFSRQPLLIFFAGIMFVVSCISVILQVTSFKLTKKRIIKMAPFHHHLELCGVHESKIVMWYFIISILGGVISILAMRAI
ncbi:MAG TPA: phospho-N-acetylmuramoyl-pentapeptide-transferase [Clostridia bacterium]|nr:phospho-N-acetylmuramoyl-pentapeptide-transferase [Clostridia bacterium]